jgi:peptidoglycan/xylan/chitin deacetylase (PgdA/CDA1 family)
MMLKSVLRRTVSAAMHYAGLFSLHRRLALRDQAVILLYHQVLAPDQVPPDVDHGIYVTTDTFDTHLRELRRSYDVVDLDDLLAWREGRRTFSRTPCAITFDDGWADNYTNAFPLLKRYGMPATIFLITSEVGRPEFVTWQQVHEMERAGIRFGSHTVNHPVVEGLPAHQLEQELAESRRQLFACATRPVDWFCYPKGYNDAPAREAARRHYRAAVTTRCAAMRRSDDPYAIPRISIHQDITSTPGTFALRLAGWTRTATG